MTKFTTQAYKEDKGLYFWYFKSVRDTYIEENKTNNRTLEHDGHF